ncbi:imidazolonepropionase-like amidohydrolase [Novosphingobium sp. PhB165]|uniref:amidohydrolase family protein n=1 Tax=Novosphingobium sp. PhB165 TaxID=2485105 RepID=UPI00104FC90A|nr:amidohydrolase family protein [Novosphingobium sp. PhB165]TCM18120.1 imidazolonepropionase-like amidohydrolase [Novosphingobium sp. PhB165]
MIRRFVPALLLASALALPAMAQSGLPMPPARVLTLHPERTTWTSVSVSPDGRTLVFDVLGDLFTMPASGGKARQISEGLAFDSQPVFSPDGQWIAFVSDRSGAENVWIARPDGKQARQITRFDDDTALASPIWSADGRSIMASRFRPDLNNYEFWQFPLSGEARLLVPVKPKDGAPRAEWRSTLGATATPDGKAVYYARRTDGLEFDMPTRWTILRRDLATGTETEVIAGTGARGTKEETFFAPLLSPDGRWLAYVTRREGLSRLRVRDLTTGEDKALGDTELDAMQASSWMGMVPSMAFTPDSAAVILSHGGRFERREIATGRSTTIDRAITARVAVGASTRFAMREETGPVEAKLAMGPAPSPDGKHVAFAALDGIWVQDLGTDKARRLSLGEGIEAPAQPSWSPDGKTLVFVTWSERAGSAIWTAPADGSAPATRVAAMPAYYRFPAFTPDGATILVLRSALEERRQTNFEFGPLRRGQLVAMARDGSGARVLTEGTLGGKPHFAASAPGSVFLLNDAGLARVDIASGKLSPVAHVTGPGWYFAEGNADADDLRISPDGRTVAAAIADRVYVMSTPADPAKEIDVLAPGTPAKVLPGMGADWFEWSAAGTLDTVNGTLFSRRNVADGQELAAMRLEATAPRVAPQGSLLLRGARVLTMADGDRVIDNADVLVTGDRIAAVGPRGTLTVPDGAQVRDVTGKTILPGFIDDHDHVGEIRRNNPSNELWGMRARLAYGVTTSFDPSTLSPDHLAYQGLVDAGYVLGPRMRSTGTAVFSKQRITSLDDARRVLSRYSEGYRTSNLKEYRTGSRAVRQWVSMAAREQHLLPTTEGALSLKLDLTQILDGYAGNEHALPAPVLGDDVIALMKAMRTSYVTTLSITNSGSPATDWFVAHDDPVVDDKLRRFWPAPAIRQKIALGRDFHPLEETRFPQIARDAGTFAQAGGLLGMGAHGEVPGIGYHWEMEAHQVGGMTPLAVLHAATAGAAETIGRLADLGTIEPGKLADMVILDTDPRGDVRAAREIASVMRGGFLYEAATLRELWPVAGDAPKAWFEGMSDEQWLPLVDSRRPDEPEH